jgi:hypothetical protein
VSAPEGATDQFPPVLTRFDPFSPGAVGIFAACGGRLDVRDEAARARSLDHRRVLGRGTACADRVLLDETERPTQTASGSCEGAGLDGRCEPPRAPSDPGAAAEPSLTEGSSSASAEIARVSSHVISPST